MGLPKPKKPGRRWGEDEEKFLTEIAQMLGCARSLSSIEALLRSKREALNIVRGELGMPASGNPLALGDIHTAVSRLREATRLEEILQSVIDKNLFTRCELLVTVGKTSSGYQATLSAREKKEQMARTFSPLMEVYSLQESKTAVLDQYNGSTLVAAVAGLKR